MTDIAIKVENLGKKYVLSHQTQRGHKNYTALRDVLSEAVSAPFYKLTSAFRSQVSGLKSQASALGSQPSSFSSSEDFWAVRDVSFEVKEGEAVGIIGRNGAGKSTLLKLLSRITEPSRGRIETHGRVASLLEVGTGFHPELTGRENIFLNGAVLGMKRQEIRKKFDEIVAFAEVERFLDTPVKRYSSGMYMRLAFAVAAHLEPDILVVDEVLAVGDAAFQKKCLGKMKDVSGREGRTVLFVSHNMQAINVLCQSAILLKQGMVEKAGTAAEVVRYYNQTDAGELTLWEGDEGDEHARLLKTEVKAGGDGNWNTDNPVEISMTFRILKRVGNLVAGFHLRSDYDTYLAYCLHDDFEATPEEYTEPGIYTKRFRIPAYTLAQGTYHLKFDLGIHMQKRITDHQGGLSFSLINTSSRGLRFPVDETPWFRSLFRPDWAVKDI